MIKVNRIFFILFYGFIFFCLIYLSGSLLMVSSNNINNYLYFILGIISIILIIYEKKLPIYKSLFLFLFSSYIILSGIYNVESVNQIIFPLLIMLSAFLISSKIEWENFIKMYITIMTFLSVSSIILFYFIRFFPGILNKFPVIILNNITFKNLLIFTIRSDYLLRNQSIFWEPGLFASYLIIAIILNEFDSNRKRVLTVIFSIAVLTTKSTTGYILLIPAILFSILNRVNDRKLLKILICALCMFFLISSFFFHNQIFGYLLTKFPKVFGKIDLNQINFTARIISPIENLEIFKSSPILGAGWTNATSVYLENISMNSLVDAQTSTSTYHLASLGIFGFIPSIILILGVSNIKKIDLFSKIIIITIIFIIINSEPFNNLLFYYCIIYYFLDFIFLEKKGRVSNVG